MKARCALRSILFAGNTDWLVRRTGTYVPYGSILFAQEDRYLWPPVAFHRTQSRAAGGGNETTLRGSTGRATWSCAWSPTFASARLCIGGFLPPQRFRRGCREGMWFFAVRGRRCLWTLFFDSREPAYPLVAVVVQSGPPRASPSRLYVRQLAAGARACPRTVAWRRSADGPKVC